MIEELRQAPDDYISFEEATADVCLFFSRSAMNTISFASKAIQISYTMGREVRYDTYHVDVIKSSLTRSLVERFPDVQNEISIAFEDYIPETKGPLNTNAQCRCA